MKNYEKPSIALLAYTQKEQVAADCRYCYAGYEDNACESQTVCWVSGQNCVPDGFSYSNG